MIVRIFFVKKVVTLFVNRHGVERMMLSRVSLLSVILRRPEGGEM